MGKKTIPNLSTTSNVVVLVVATPLFPTVFGKVGRPHELKEPHYSDVLLHKGAKG